MSTKIDPTRPVCTKQGLRAVITDVSDDGSRLMGNIVFLDGSTISLGWNSDGEYGDDTPWHIMNVPDGFEMIDLNRPAQLVGGAPVLNLKASLDRKHGVFLTGEIDFGDHLETGQWTSFGSSIYALAGPDDYRVGANPRTADTLRNVPGAAPFKPLIDLDLPLETVEGYEVDILRYTNPYRIDGYIGYPWGGKVRTAWDLYGNVVSIEDATITGKAMEAYAIRNKPTPEQVKQVEQERIADERSAIP